MMFAHRPGIGRVWWGGDTGMGAVAVCVSELVALTSAALTDAGCTSVVTGSRAAKCLFSKPWLLTHFLLLCFEQVFPKTIS